MIGQGGRINRDAPDELPFQESPAPRPPKQNEQELERISPQQPRQRFPEQISLDERAVQVHAERDWIGGCIGRWRHAVVS
jgi:hypothetical protein